MTSLLNSTTLKSLIPEENRLLFKQWLQYPSQLETFIPTSSKLVHLIANQLDITSKTIIVEIGATTGRLSRALLEKGVSSNLLAMIESNKAFVEFLKRTLKDNYDLDQPHIIQGNAKSLTELIPSSWVKKVDYVISILPLAYMEEEERERISQSMLTILNPETGVILHVSSLPSSPIEFMNGELVQRRIASVWRNLPPSFIWRFSQKHYSHHFA